ncbi:M23 family metallopeptidase [Paenibacillus sp. TRM 82003]|nr:M23 family metallopeptidase [Paenibacillus sp. TRM 82003]MCI3923443.1 M23 family metallopeptidase [Paenibacillus sp. TRM 82003]
MKDENKFQPSQGEQNRNSQPVEGPRASASNSFWKRLLAKKWVFPATYMAAAAIILTLMWAYQNNEAAAPVTEDEIQLGVTGDVTGETQGPDAIAVTAEPETLGWPVQDQASLEVIMGYFDVNNTTEDNQAAMVEYGDTFTPHTGIDIASPNNEAFDVLAAMSGTVTRVEQVPVVGQLIEITHENGLSTVYSALEDVQVSEGDEVAKGDMIARSGRSELEKEHGLHVHFEVWQNGQPVNPEDHIQ